MKGAIAICSMFALAACLAMGAAAADKAEDAKPKYNIKEVMKGAHAGGNNALLKKVIAGSASAEETKQLLEMYQSLAKNDPPKGDADSWKAKTEALVKAANAAVEGKADAGKQLDAASKCGACHGVHKPPAS